MLWSFGPDLTWVAFNLTAFYLAVLAVLGLTSVRGLQLLTAGYGYVVVATAVGVYAFLGKAMPDVVTHAHSWARLSSPIGYWNVLALMMVLGLCVALSLAGDRRMHPALRTAVAAAAVPMCFTFFFAFSRGGWIALLVALALYFAFTTTRLASLFSLAAIVVPVALVLWRLRGLDTLFTETVDDALRTLQGGELWRWSIAALLVAAGAQLVLALAQRAVRWPRWSTVAAGVVVLVVIGVLAVGGSARFLEPRGGVSWVEDRVRALLTDSAAGTTYPSSGPGRLVSLNTGRPELWREALRQSRFDRVSGTGAGTFPFTHYRFRENGGVVKHAHSQWYNVLSELGVVGLGAVRGGDGAARGGGGRQSVLAAARPTAPAAGGDAGRRHRLRRPSLLGLGLGHGRRRYAGLRLHRRVRLVSGDAGRGTSGARTGRRLRPGSRRPESRSCRGDLRRRPAKQPGRRQPAWLRRTRRSGWTSPGAKTAARRHGGRGAPAAWAGRRASSPARPSCCSP